MKSISKLIATDYVYLYKRKINPYLLVRAYIFNLNFRVLVRYRIQKCLYSSSISVLKIFSVIVRNGTIKKYGIEFGQNSIIGPGLLIHHLNGIVIGEGAVIGENVNLYQQVTIGSKDGKYPIIGDFVTIYPGSRIVGEITIGNRVTIGANSFISKNIENNGIAYGSNLIKYPQGNANE